MGEAPVEEEAARALLEEGADDGSRWGADGGPPGGGAAGARMLASDKLEVQRRAPGEGAVGHRFQWLLKLSMALVLGAALLNALAPLGARSAPPGAAEAVDRQQAAQGPLPAAEASLWDVAHAKAVEVEARLTDGERFALLHGAGAFRPSGRPAEGYYVGNTAPVRRLGIPALKLQDASSGFRPTGRREPGTSTCWPSLLALASTWDATLVGRVAAAIAREFRGKGANALLGPGVNVHRSARGGRNFEYLSGEDPYLGASLVPAYVRGVQGEGVLAVVKHFAFNEQETERETESSNVDERTAWELYYPPFEAAIRAGAGAVMCAYNRVNGTAACEHPGLLQRDLRERMGFRGFVVSDWWAAHSTGALERGLDMEMPTGHFLSDRRLGNASRGAVRGAVRHVLAAVYRLRLDNQHGCEPPCLRERRTDQRTAAHRALARRAAARAVVLLQNRGGALPLAAARARRLAILGLAAGAEDTTVKWGEGSPYSGGGSGHVLAPSVVTPVEGIRQRASKMGINVTASTDGNIAEAQKLARDADYVIVVGAATSSESRDRASLILAQGANELISAVASIQKTIVLMEIPGAVVTPWRNKVAAVACLFLGGEETGHAWASVLFGDEEPAGRLPIGLPASEFDAIQPGIGGRVDYAEGLLTSYRSPSLRFAFPFGHGLSYTRFAYGPARAARGCGAEAEACVLLNASNAGDRKGTEVVQAYIRFPAEAGEPKLVLRGYHRTKELLPGEGEEVRLGFTRRDLSIYRSGQGWVLQHDFEVHIGASSDDIRQVVAPLQAHPPSAIHT